MQFPNHHRQPRAADRLAAHITAAELAAGWTDAGDGHYTWNAGGQPSGANAGGVILQANTEAQVSVEGVGVLFWTGSDLFRPTKRPNNGARIPIISGTQAGKSVVFTDGLPNAPENTPLAAFLTAADQAANWQTALADGTLKPEVANDPPEVDSHELSEGELVGATGINGGVYEFKGGYLVPVSIPENGQVHAVANGTNHGGQTTAYASATGFPNPA